MWKKRNVWKKDAASSADCAKRLNTEIDEGVPIQSQFKGLGKHIFFSSCKLSTMKMIARMISGNITIRHHPPHAGGGGMGWGDSDVSGNKF
jgi:hypothetical protein